MLIQSFEIGQPQLGAFQADRDVVLVLLAKMESMAVPLQ